MCGALYRDPGFCCILDREHAGRFHEAHADGEMKKRWAIEEP